MPRLVVRNLSTHSFPLARVAIFVVSLMLVTYVTASAHVTLLSSEPAAGASLTVSPLRVRLVFSEAIEGGLAHIALTSAQGGRVDLRVNADPRDVHALIAPVDSLPPGAYRVSWRVVSADGHPVSGDFTFIVVGSSVVPAPVTPLPPPPPAEVAGGMLGFSVAQAPLVAATLRGLAIGSLMALAGMLFFASSGRAPAPSALTRATMALAVAAPLLLTAHLLAWLVNVTPSHRPDMSAVRDTLSTSVARLPLAELGLAALALWALALVRRRGLACVFALGAVIAGAAIGHPAAIRPALAVPVTAVHLLAVSLWLGGLLTLLVLSADDTSAFLRQARRVSSIAFLTVALVLASGVCQALLFLPSLGDLLRSAYGAVILMKAGGLVTLVAFGAYHRYRLMPRLAAGATPTHLQRSVRREISVMVVVILLGGLLAYIPPRGIP